MTVSIPVDLWKVKIIYNYQTLRYVTPLFSYCTDTLRCISTLAAASTHEEKNHCSLLFFFGTNENRNVQVYSMNLTT